MNIHRGGMTKGLHPTSGFILVEAPGYGIHTKIGGRGGIKNVFLLYLLGVIYYSIYWKVRSGVQ